MKQMQTCEWNIQWIKINVKKKPRRENFLDSARRLLSRYNSDSSWLREEVEMISLPPISFTDEGRSLLFFSGNGNNVTISGTFTNVSSKKSYFSIQPKVPCDPVVLQYRVLKADMLDYIHNVWTQRTVWSVNINTDTFPWSFLTFVSSYSSLWHIGLYKSYIQWTFLSVECWKSVLRLLHFCFLFVRC